MAFDLTAAASILKENYLGPIRNQLNQATPVLAEIQRKTEGVVGKEVYVPLHTARGEAVGARADGGSLPTARNQSYKESTFKVRYQYARIEITLPTIETTKSDTGAFLRAVDAETKGAMNDLKEDFDRQVCSNDEAGTGTLAAIQTAGSSGTTYSTSGANAATYRRARAGVYVDVFDSTGVTQRTGPTKVSSNSPSSSTITFDVAVSGVADGDIVVRTGSNGNEMVGIPGIVKATGTLQNISSSTVATWKASVFGNSGTARALSEDLMQQVIDDVAINAGEEPDAIACEHTQRRKFYALLSSMKRAVNTLDLKGGYKTIAFNDNIPLLVDRFFDADKMYFINRSHLALYEMTDWTWADQDGAVLSRVAGKPNFEAFLYKFANLGTDQRNAHGVLQDLAQ